MSTASTIDTLLAARVRSERLDRNWSLADLADQSGVSKAMISKIERGEVSATAALLVRVATAFQMTIATLFVRAEQRDDRVTRKADRQTWTDPETGYSREQLLIREDSPLELVSVELPPGAVAAVPCSSLQSIHQAIWVLSGSLGVTEGDETLALSEGDCLTFGPPVDVKFRNPGDAPCRYLVAVVRKGGREWK